MRKSILLFLLLMTAASLFADSSKNFFQTEAEIGLERAMLDGHIRIGSDQNSSNLDLQNDLGMMHATGGLQAILTRSTTHHKFGFKLEKYEHSGSTKLSQNILYNSSAYATASLISSKFCMKWAKLKYRYKVSQTFSAGIDLNGMRLKTLVNENEYKKTLVLPALGIDYETMLEEGLQFIAKASTTIANNSNYHYAYAGLSYDLKILHCSALHIGYQYKNLEINADEIHTDLTYQGLYAGLAMKF